jgi:hypothetical protein
MHKARERENNGWMNGNKNGKNEDEFEKSVHVRERAKERKKKSGHLPLTLRYRTRKNLSQKKENFTSKKNIE